LNGRISGYPTSQREHGGQDTKIIYSHHIIVPAIWEAFYPTAMTIGRKK
jgi:hypothetical protein